MSHMPTPYRVIDDMIGAVDGNADMVCRSPAEILESYAYWPGNAAFIVRACNSHAALVEALIAARNELRSIVPLTTEGDEDFAAWPTVMKIDAALALAEGRS